MSSSTPATGGGPRDHALVEVLERMRNRFFGKYRGVVTDVDAGTMRVKASVPAVLGQQPSGWARPCVTIIWQTARTGGEAGASR